MSLPNRNPETGIRYGIISANKLRGGAEIKINGYKLQIVEA